MEMKKSTVLWGVIGLLFIVALFMVFSAGEATTVQAAGQVARNVAPPVAQASSGMVGGC